MMKRLLSLAVASCCVLAGSLSASAHDADVNTLDGRATRGAFRPGELIVKFRASSLVEMKAPRSARFKTTRVSDVDKVFSHIGVAEVEQLMPLSGGETFRRAARGINGKEVVAREMDRAYLLKLTDASADVLGAVEALRGLGDVEYAEPNYLVYALDGEITGTPDDTYYDMQYGLEAINMSALWASPVINKEGPVIAILDTGVDITHPDLAANIWTNPGEADGASGYDDDRNGYADDLHGWDFVNQTGEIYDYNGHGTHCAGIAAACGFNGVGIVGANPDARIMPLTVMQSNGTGDMGTIIKAIDYAAANGADIISMSLGSYSASVALEEALGRAYQKSVIVAAAGNDGYCLNHAHPEKAQSTPMPMFPAAYSFVLGVQASAQGGGRAAFSNYDDNGPAFSAYPESQLYNYELTVPGASIMSTYPGGGYKQLNGTSMATPLVAGAVSRLLQCKEYLNKEELFGDLINSKTLKGDLDIYAAYGIKDTDRKPQLQFVTIEMADEDGDGRADAGEQIAFYPVIRNSWGNATNIRFTVEGAETVNNTFTIDEASAEFGVNLSSYGKARALNPVRIKFNPDVADGRIVRLKFTAQADNAPKIEQELEIMVENAEELTGILDHDMTLYPEKHYVVKGIFGIPEGITLTLKPGVTLKFEDGSQLVCTGVFDAKGEKGNMITFTKTDLGLGNVEYFNIGENSLHYCVFKDLSFRYRIGSVYNSIFKNCNVNSYAVSSTSWYNSSIESVNGNPSLLFNGEKGIIYNSNFVNLTENTSYDRNYGVVVFEKAGLRNSNVFNNVNRKIGSKPFSFHVCNGLNTFKPEFPCYPGTSSLEKAKELIIDVNHPDNKYINTLTQYDFSNTPWKPYSEAPGIVWKVLVNGKDAQDEFDQMDPLGIGTHEFKVYFNRLMNENVAPTVAMGVRAPYTQTAIGEGGKWSVEDGVSVYTVKVTISGKNNIDGVNRIYVAGAQDDEFFEIPVENMRFNALVQATGSLSSGFVAEPGLGRVTLTWDNEEEKEIDDIIGFNMYRYEIAADGSVSDTICVNRQLIEPGEEMELVDYDVVPRHTYAYYYKTMRTDMSETSPSRTVAATLETATKGDANGSGDVDVADVITTVNYASGLAPKPFIFEAADMNADLSIDILDVVGIIRTILSPDAAATSALAEATYWVDEDGILYIDSPVSLAGLQLNLSMDRNGSVSGLAALNGFEQTGAWRSENEYVFMAYNMNGRTIEPGRNAVARISGGEIDDIRLSDPMGANVTAILEADNSGVEDVAAEPEIRPYARGIYTVTGVKLANSADELQTLPAGVYIVNGQKVVK